MKEEKEREARLKGQQLHYTPNCTQENRPCQFYLGLKSRTQAQGTFLKDCFWRTASMVVQETTLFYCYFTAWFWEQTKYSANTFMHRSLNIIRHSCRPQCFFSLQYTENLWMHFPILFYVGRTALNIWMEFVPGYVSVHSSERTHTQSIVSILFIGLHFLQGQIFHETSTFGNVHIRHFKKSPHSFSLSSPTRRVVSRKISYMAAFSKDFSELRNQSGRTLSVRRSLEMYEVAKK